MVFPEQKEVGAPLERSVGRAADETPVGLCDLFKIGMGPSSSHTLGPMVAAGRFINSLGDAVATTSRLTASAYGSLAWTGRGHATDKAMILGLAGEPADDPDPERADACLRLVSASKALTLPNGRVIAFDPTHDVIFDMNKTFKQHPNAMSFTAYDASGSILRHDVWFSVGGGFVEREGASCASEGRPTSVPFPFTCGADLLTMGQRTQQSIADIVMANEDARRDRASTFALVDKFAAAMFACIERGLASTGELPGGLKVARRAKGLYELLAESGSNNELAPTKAMSYVSTFAIAVSEENAGGGRIVTAPTNGAAGVVPAVLRYYRDFLNNSNSEGIRRFLLTATAVGAIIKRNASISGAEVGCQGEVGSAAAMAAAGLVAALGGTNAQIENAAEIAIEHHLGMTCDPVGGLVQIPCIERNAFGAVKAIAASSLALHGDGTHRVTLDQVIETMRQTGADMSSKYRETARGGLAVNVPAC